MRTANHVVAALTLAVASFSLASDHNNLEIGRPLSFDDAYSIAYGERAFEFGSSATGSNANRPVYGFMSELQYGFAKNRDLSVSFDSQFPNAPTSFGLSYFENLTRELDHAPALGYRVSFEQVGNQTSTGLTLAGTKAWHQYDKLHGNIVLNSRSTPGVILGYSTPLGYPTRFDTTLLGQVGYQDKVGQVGLGLRKQVGPQSVVDAGVTTGGGKTSLTFGYSRSF